MLPVLEDILAKESATNKTTMKPTHLKKKIINMNKTNAYQIETSSDDSDSNVGLLFMDLSSKPKKAGGTNTNSQAEGGPIFRPPPELKHTTTANGAGMFSSSDDMGSGKEFDNDSEQPTGRKRTVEEEEVSSPTRRHSSPKRLARSSAPPGTILEHEQPDIMVSKRSRSRSSSQLDDGQDGDSERSDGDMDIEVMSGDDMDNGYRPGNMENRRQENESKSDDNNISFALQRRQLRQQQSRRSSATKNQEYTRLEQDKNQKMQALNAIKDMLSEGRGLNNINSKVAIASLNESIQQLNEKMAIELQQDGQNTSSHDSNSFEARRFIREEQRKKKPGLATGENELNYWFSELEIEKYGNGKWKARRKDCPDLLDWRLCSFHAVIKNGLQVANNPIDQRFFSLMNEILHDVPVLALLKPTLQLSMGRSESLIDLALEEAMIPRCTKCKEPLCVANASEHCGSYGDVQLIFNDMITEGEHKGKVKCLLCKHFSRTNLRCTAKVPKWVKDWAAPDRRQ